MVINLNVLQSQPSANLKVTLLVETLENGQFVASIFEFQDDSDFQEIMDEIRAERTSDDDTEVDSSYYL
jgi:hypothetical protein